MLDLINSLAPCVANLRHSDGTALYQISESVGREPPPTGEDLIITNTINSLIVWCFLWVFLLFFFSNCIFLLVMTSDWLIGGDSAHFISNI